jgi:NADH-quinone oxidoreductase subunit N
MSPSLASLLPLIILAGAMPLLLIILCLVRSHGVTFYVTLLTIAASLAALETVTPGGAPRVGILFVFDGLTFFYGGLLLAGGLVVAVLSREYLSGRPGDIEEYYVLLLGAMLGSLVLVASRHFASLFLGLELLSISLYPLIAYRRKHPHHAEAGLKYLILSGVASAFLLFGMALVYGVTGAMDFTRIGARLADLPAGQPMALAGMVFLIIGIGFKIGLVPFHMWAPDVYEGSPAPVAAFIATISKGSMIGLLLRYFSNVSFSGLPRLFAIFAIMGVASMFAGNLLALFQDSIKRLLAYSSIAHFGYLLVAFVSTGSLRIFAVTYYLVAYVATTLGAFGVVVLLSGKEHDADAMDAYEGMGRRSPWLGGMLAFMLLSLAGMPLTAGFIAKFYVVAAGVGSALWALVLILIVNSAIGLFYYLRVIAVLYRSPFAEAPPCPSPGIRARVVMIVLLAVVIWWGVYPSHLATLIQAARVGQ